MYHFSSCTLTSTQWKYSVLSPRVSSRRKMGKKDKKSKKGKGAEKTAAKTEKKQAAKMKKEIAAIGEDDIENIVAQIEAEERKRNEVVEKKVEAPDRRINFSFVAHPEKDELILFGGEYFNGQKTNVYNDLFIYNIQRNEWTSVKARGGCPPRCGHQMVALPTAKGQLWVFGGEFTSPSESQFYHYRDLWVYHVAGKEWEKINATGGPSARSGHRMVVCKKQLIVFGGFHDNLRSYKYFNDVHIFDLEKYQWKEIKPSGNPPAPRSACQMVALPDGKALIWGGYSKESKKKDVDKGVIHSDMFLLSPEKRDTTGTKWKWQQVKPGGVTISPRTGAAAIAAPGCRAYSFGGVYDEEQTEEDLEGTFFNDLFLLDFTNDKFSWRTVSLSGKKDPAADKRRRRKKDDEMEEDEGESEHVMEIDAPAVETVHDDGIFKVTVGPSTGASGPSGGQIDVAETSKAFVPSPRMNGGLAVKHGVLYLYGGMREVGDRQITLRDMYALDLHKQDEWRVILNDDEDQEWIDSEDDDDEGEDEDEDEEEGEDEDEDEEGEEEEDSDTEPDDEKMA